MVTSWRSLYSKFYTKILLFGPKFRTRILAFLCVEIRLLAYNITVWESRKISFMCPCLRKKQPRNSHYYYKYQTLLVTNFCIYKHKAVYKYKFVKSNTFENYIHFQHLKLAFISVYLCFIKLNLLIRIIKWIKITYKIIVFLI